MTTHAVEGLPVGLSAVYRAFSSWRFPVFVLSFLAGYELLLLSVLLLPAPAGVLAEFAEEFRTWCFGYDPATGKMNGMYVGMMLSEPVAISAIIAFVWWPQILEARAPARRAAVLRTVGWAAVPLLVGSAAFGMLKTEPETGELPFPGNDIRTAHLPPSFELVDQAGAKASLEQERGRVVIVTGVYATCGFTCPMIMSQVKRALGELSAAEALDVRVMALTLDPERDNPEVLARMAEGQRVSAPTYRFLSGEPAQVNQALDSLGVARTRNAETGVIDHANLFLVLDREGKIAYRFTLGDRQERWLVSALKQLLAEPSPR